MTTNLKVLCWNVRGMNEKEKRLAIKQTPKLEKPNVICFQETKLSQTSVQIISQACGNRYSQFLTVDALQGRGGLLTAWDPNILEVENSLASTFHLTVDFIVRKDGSKLRLTNLYGPSNQIGRDVFLRDIRSVCPGNNTPWMLCGDFNLTLQLQERTNPLYNRSGTAEFADLVDELQLLDLDLEGRTFTWSNLRLNPSMARLDRFLLNRSFANSYPNIHQKALANTSSDHCPLLCSFCVRFQPTNVFRIENYFLKIPEFIDLVLNFWLTEEVADTPNSFDSKLSSLTRLISTWKKGRISALDRQLQSIRDYLAWTDRVAEDRPLSELELLVRALLKRRFTVLAEWDETRWRQRSAATWRLKGD
ncbi:DNA-(apurinic or apyrimidinic site) lyase [Rhynchospora pubera]|uniref:DNA-(Apurinic or apyrimidinic site) lyase n=1 Tax=Rhynchospora pubera TaxID=906938 RepID=A0AAV8CQH6_9POAL|nr:DNA-(apurinic or apyrimidinic site) lyase [Rhynchospora pubera]